MSRSLKILMALATVTLAGCSAAGPGPASTPTPAGGGPVTSNDPTATPSPPGPDNVAVGTAEIDSVQFLMLESFPVQIRAQVKGNLPDGCTTIGDITQTRDNFTITVMITTVRPAVTMCTQGLVPYEHSVAIEAYGLPKGTYTVLINGFKGSFDLTSDNKLP